MWYNSLVVAHQSCLKGPHQNLFKEPNWNRLKRNDMDNLFLCRNTHFHSLLCANWKPSQKELYSSAQKLSLLLLWDWVFNDKDLNCCFFLTLYWQGFNMNSLKIHLNPKIFLWNPSAAYFKRVSTLLVFLKFRRGITVILESADNEGNCNYIRIHAKAILLKRRHRTVLTVSN